MKQISPTNKPLLVSFSGIDGAGKSTQISQLCDTLHIAGLRVKLITFWDDVATLRSFREEVGHKVFHGDKGVGSPQAPIRRRDKDVQSPFVTLFRMAIYLLDAISLRVTVKRVLRQKLNVPADVIIFDRFLYDELANLKLSSPLNRCYVNAMLQFHLPTPDLPLVLDANPDAAFARKPEYPLEFLHSNRKAYLDLARIAKMTVVASSSIGQMQTEVFHHVQQKHYALRTGITAAGRSVDRNQFAS